MDPVLKIKSNKIHLALKIVPINPTICGFFRVIDCSIGLEKSNSKFSNKFSLKAIKSD